MSVVKLGTVPHRVPDPTHPYTSGAWTPVFDEYDADGLEVIGEIPKDIDGIYVRNSENPAFGSIGLYHPFDGDGMMGGARCRLLGDDVYSRSEAAAGGS